MNIDSSIIHLFLFFSDEPKAETEVVSEDQEIKVAGYLNLAADAFHNFTDGNSSINAFKSQKKLESYLSSNVPIFDVYNLFSKVWPSGPASWQATLWAS